MQSRSANRLTNSSVEASVETELLDELFAEYMCVAFTISKVCHCLPIGDFPSPSGEVRYRFETLAFCHSTMLVSCKRSAQLLDRPATSSHSGAGLTAR